MSTPTTSVSQTQTRWDQKNIYFLKKALLKEDFKSFIAYFQSGADLAERIAGTTLLSTAIHQSSYDMVKLITLLNAPLDQKSKILHGHEETPLISAIRLRRDDVLNHLLYLGARLDIHGYGDKTPLWFSAKENNLNYVKLILSHGSVINFKEYHQNPINLISHFLGYMVREIRFLDGAILFPINGYRTNKVQRLIMIELILAGLDPLQKDVRSFTPTFWTSRSADIGLTTLLVEAGALLNHGPSLHSLFIPAEWKSSNTLMTWVNKERTSPPPLLRLTTIRIRNLIRYKTNKDIRLSLNKLPLPQIILDILSLKEPANFAASKCPPKLLPRSVRLFQPEQILTSPRLRYPEQILPSPQNTQDLITNDVIPPPIFNEEHTINQHGPSS